MITCLAIPGPGNQHTIDLAKRRASLLGIWRDKKESIIHAERNAMNDGYRGETAEMILTGLEWFDSYGNFEEEAALLGRSDSTGKRQRGPSALKKRSLPPSAEGRIDQSK